jgi:hypothetical protein
MKINTKHICIDVLLFLYFYVIMNFIRCNTYSLIRYAFGDYERNNLFVLIMSCTLLIYNIFRYSCA